MSNQGGLTPRGGPRGSQSEGRFDWGEIGRAAVLIIAAAAVVMWTVPLIGALLNETGSTSPMAGNEVYRWAIWAVAWVVTIWQGQVLIKKVGDRIIDDMLAVSIIAAIVLLVLKLFSAVAYVPVGSEGQNLAVLTFIDLGGALMLVVVAMIGARINRY
ncbi:MAG: hypothetical protein GYB68_04700 [Chloroflexi bacterium]|nr:hypothetical protein [Chloroflexota bacterium]